MSFSFLVIDGTGGVEFSRELRLIFMFLQVNDDSVPQILEGKQNDKNLKKKTLFPYELY